MSGLTIRHAFTGHIYEELDDGLVRVLDPSTGHEGVFTKRAEWRSGELRYADFHMCGAVGGRKAASGLAAMMTDESDGANGSGRSGAAQD
jgi:hypothetical protein